MQLFDTPPTTRTASPSITRQIEKIRKGMIQKNLIISHSTTSADRGRIQMINELLKN